MTTGAGSRLRRDALRTASLATVLVALGLSGLLTATDGIVSHNLTAAIDGRLSQWMTEVAAQPALAATETDPDHDFDEPVLSWAIQADGQCRAIGGAPSLPAHLCATMAPTTAVVAGTPFRLLGRRTAEGGLVVGASLAAAAQQMGDLVLAEFLVGPLLLLLVFGGAFAVGSRVGGPLERMRQRQLAFTADASHELRTPLTVMQAEASLALSGSDRDLRPALRRFSGEIGRMRQIVEDLLWLARVDSEPRSPRPVLIDLGTATRLAADRFSTVAAARSLSLTVVAPQSVLPISIPADWLDRLVGVLVDNACRHAHSAVRVEVRAVEGGRAELSVTDDGEGVPEQELPRLFDRFHRGTSLGEGAGLGLAIADQVVRASHGHWRVTNPGAGGARFAVVWPLAKDASERARAGEASPDGPA
jgi:signal transduction histidine kinase